MGSGIDELHILPQVCRPITVEAGELRGAATQVEAIARLLAARVDLLVQVDHHLQAAASVPGGALSAAPARASLAAGMHQLRTALSSLEPLAPHLQIAADRYETAEGFSQRLLAGLGTGATWWMDSYGVLPPSPLVMATAPLSRYFTARMRRELAPYTPGRAGTPARIITGLFGAGVVRHHQIRTLSPTGWVSYGQDVFHTGRLLPRALSPALTPGAPGLGRDEGAVLARSLSGTVIPGGDVGQGAGLAALGVDALHGVLGHTDIRMERLAPKHDDTDPDRRPVRSVEGAVEVMTELDPGAGATYGELRIDRVTSEFGEHSWQVFIPGGQGFNPTDVHALLHTVRSVDSRPTPSTRMVADALRTVGARKGEPIIMTGHSHGGITASAFANDPRMRAEFDVPLVITAGSPVDRHEIRPDTHVVSLEHTEDVIPGLDGVAREAKPGMTRVERTLADSADPDIADGSGIYHAHDYPNYVDTARLVDEHPDMAHVRGQIEAIIPDGQVETYRFRADIVP